MNAIRIIAVVLMLAGALGLVYGGFTYTRETEQARIGPVQLTVKDQRTVNIPIWAGVAALAIGTLLLVVPRAG